MYNYLIIMKAKFITFEGPDGSGKTTALKGLLKYLDKKYPKLDYIFTREPGGSVTAESIRDVILDKENSDMDYEVEALLYATARRQHLSSTIWPALKNNKIVFCDRYIHSSLAYQGYARGLGIKHIEEMNNLATNNTWPDITIYFNISVKEAQSRVNKRTTMNDRLESENDTFRQKVHDGYDEVIKKYGDKIKVIDASKSEAEVLQQIIDIVECYI